MKQLFSKDGHKAASGSCLDDGLKLHLNQISGWTDVNGIYDSLGKKLDHKDRFIEKLWEITMMRQWGIWVWQYAHMLCLAIMAIYIYIYINLYK